jgi:hypothetical protein
MNNIQKALNDEELKIYDDIKGPKVSAIYYKKCCERHRAIIESLYNIVEDEKVDYKGTTVGCSIYSEGYNNCKKEILSKFNDKLGIKGE